MYVKIYVYKHADLFADFYICIDTSVYIYLCVRLYTLIYMCVCDFP